MNPGGQCFHDNLQADSRRPPPAALKVRSHTGPQPHPRGAAPSCPQVTPQVPLPWSAGTPSTLCRAFSLPRGPPTLPGPAHCLVQCETQPAAEARPTVTTERRKKFLEKNLYLHEKNVLLRSSKNISFANTGVAWKQRKPRGPGHALEHCHSLPGVETKIWQRVRMARRKSL